MAENFRRFGETGKGSVGSMAHSGVGNLELGEASCR